MFCSYQADTHQVEMDGEGMKVDELEALLDRLEADGRRPKFIYSVPTFQNPAGVTLSAERRRRLVELAREREVLVVEDNPYGLLRYEGEPQPPLYQLDGGDYVIYVGTLSKILSPGIRLGWAVAPPPVMEKMALGKQATDLCTSTLAQYFALEYFAEDRWRSYVDSLCGIYRSRRDAMLEALERHFPEQATWTRPAGRAVRLGHPALLHRHLRPARQGAPRERRLRSRAPPPTSTGSRGRSSMRLNFSGSDEDEIREGIRRIGKVVGEQVALYETITGEHQLPAAAGRRLDGPATQDRPLEGDGDVVPLRRREEP